MAARPANPALAVDILRVTTDLIEEQGPDAIKMRDVAERLGISATTIYLYYKDKCELFQAAVDRAFEWFADAQDEAERSAEGVDVLRSRARAYVAWGVDHPNVYRSMFEQRQSYTPARSSARRRSYRAFGDAVERLMESGDLQCFENVDLMCNLVWATLHGLVSLIISGRMFGPLGEALTQEQARERILGLADASFEQWMRVWGLEEPGMDLYGRCAIGDGPVGDDGCGCGDGECAG